MTEISISRLEMNNAGLLDQVAEGVFNDPIDPQLLRAYLAFPGSLLVVALDRDLVIGQIKAAVHLHPDKPADLYVDELAVAPTHRRRGIARRMFEEAESWARERGCADVWLAADPDNQAARSLYEGFAQSKPSILFFWDL